MLPHRFRKRVFLLYISPLFTRSNPGNLQKSRGYSSLMKPFGKIHYDRLQYQQSAYRSKLVFWLLCKLVYWVVFGS
jgi:hypothetical protein